MFSWLRLCTRALLFLPLATTISFYIFTNLSTFEANQFATKLVIIWLLHAAMAVPITIIRLQNTGNPNILIVGTLSYHLLTVMGWWVLAKCLSIRWCINFKWVPVIQICQAGTYIIAGLPITMRQEYLSDIVIYIPIVMIVLEFLFAYVLRASFKAHQNNEAGRVLTIASLLFPLEATRFACFVMLYYGWKKNHIPFRELVWYVIFSLLGEIYTHSGLYQIAYSWLESKIEFVDLHDYFPEVVLDISSIRAILE